MKAIIRTKAGKNFSTIQIATVQVPTPKSNELIIEMKSSRINPVYMDLMKGFPSIKYKTPQFGGSDGAGIVKAVGNSVTNFKPGDKVFFYCLFSDFGTWAEEIAIKASYCAKIPDQIPVEQAGAIALPLLTAYDSLEQLKSKAGEQILIHGAAGGVGFQAVQLALKMGLRVIATASEKDADELKQLGVQLVIDYKKQNFEDVLKESHIDYVFDVLGGQILQKSIAMKPKKVVSLKHINVDQMYKAGVNLPGILKFIMRLMTRKNEKLARKLGVELIGQVTGANGPLLQEASLKIADSFKNRIFDTITLEDIEKHGMSEKSIGKVILF